MLTVLIKQVICIFNNKFTVKGGQGVGGSWRETGGWAQFDWMLDGGSLKTQPIGSHLVYLKKMPIDVSQKLLVLVLQIQ